MASLQKYFALIKQYPSLFANPEVPDLIRIITDPQEIRHHQQRIRAQNMAKGHPAAWIDIGVLADDPWYLVVRDLVEFPGGYTGGYIRFINRKSLEGGTSVVVLPVQAGKVILISHFRHDFRCAQWELPAGFGEPGLDARENALKELREEIGAVPLRLEVLSHETQFEDNRIAFYYAELDPNEEIQVEMEEGIGGFAALAPAEFEAWVQQGIIVDGNTIKGYLLALTQGYIQRVS